MRYVCPLQQHPNPMYAALGVWPNCRLETNPFCWRQTVGCGWETTFQSDRFQCTADINSNVADIYCLVWSLSRLLCCVGSGSIVAAALLRLCLSETHAPFCLPPPPGLFIVRDNKRYHQNHLIPCAVPVTDSCVVYIYVLSLKSANLISSV